MKIPLETKELLIKEYVASKKLQSEIYAKQEELIAQMVELDEPLIIKNEDGTWTRITITDNLENLDKGFYAPARVSRYSPRVDVLKNMPKELKEKVA